MRLASVASQSPWHRSRWERPVWCADLKKEITGPVSAISNNQMNVAAISRHSTTQNARPHDQSALPPPHVDSLLWRLSSPQERTQLAKAQPTNHCESHNAARGRTALQGFGEIPSYRGNLPSPLQVMWYAPEGKEVLKAHYPDSEIRSWVKDAAAYNDVPHEMLAVVLQQENAPSASKWKQFLQFGERSVTTFAAIVDEVAFGFVPDKISGGSSGIANMKRETLRNGASYIESTYCRPALPGDVRHRVLGWNQDTRLPGDDLKADLYYASAVLRQLIDKEMGTGYRGPISPEHAQNIIASYNGSGPLAQKYGSDAINTLHNAATGRGKLYFYEK